MFNRTVPENAQRGKGQRGKGQGNRIWNFQAEIGLFPLVFAVCGGLCAVKRHTAMPKFNRARQMRLPWGKGLRGKGLRGKGYALYNAASGTVTPISGRARVAAIPVIVSGSQPAERR